jgi:hypothetical protein
MTGATVIAPEQLPATQSPLAVPPGKSNKLDPKRTYGCPGCGHVNRVCPACGHGLPGKSPR